MNLGQDDFTRLGSQKKPEPEVQCELHVSHTNPTHFPQLCPAVVGTKCVSFAGSLKMRESFPCRTVEMPILLSRYTVKKQ